MGKLTISMAMFNSYVSLPEGNLYCIYIYIYIYIHLAMNSTRGYSIWVCLKIVYPEKPNGFADDYPY